MIAQAVKVLHPRSLLWTESGDYRIVLADCDDTARARRLSLSRNTRLGNPTMMNWAKLARLLILCGVGWVYAFAE
jgi:hypothetical protein